MTDATNRSRVQSGVPAGGEFAVEQRTENEDLTVPETPPEPKVIRSYIRESDGLVFVEFEPTPVDTGQWKLMLFSAYTWVGNGPSYALGRGKVIKKDGTVGTRIVETYNKDVPKSILRAMQDMFDEREAKAAAEKKDSDD